MIITDQFVMLNFPKTGSSFVRQVLKNIHGYNHLPNRLRHALHLEQPPPMIELLLPVVEGTQTYKTRGPHGTYQQIPDEHRHKTIVSLVRNPYDRYISAYLYGFWKKKYSALFPDIIQEYPNFPNISFVEYYHLAHLHARTNKLKGISPKVDLGVNTIQFIQFYFPYPQTVLTRIDEDYITEKHYTDDMPTIRFLHQENLNQELHAFLANCGYPQQKIAFLRNAKRINVSQRGKNQQMRTDFITSDLAEQIYKRDRLLFDLFPEYKWSLDKKDQVDP
ncbi:MAG: sulfotransferase family 2 domain-containing protein [Anaerolineales bacterium]|nr:sulfotransferase family 2 domain-containing protein [Anaerolineales bacterium]